MKIRWLWMVMSVALAFGGRQILADEESEQESGSSEVSVDFLSAYVWRGITFNNGFVAQPAVDLLHPSGLGFNVWGNVDLDDYDGRYEKGEFSEVDLTVRYELPLEGPLGLTIAYAEYLYPKEGNYSPEDPAAEPVKDQDTKEVSAQFSFTPIEDLSMVLGIYRDVDESEGWYGDVSVFYSYDLTDTISLEGNVRVGMADNTFAEFSVGGTEGGLFDWGATLAAEYQIANGFSLGATVSYVNNLDDDVFPEDASTVNVYGGVNATLSF